MRSALFILVLLGVLSVNAQDPCFARITASPRAGSSWDVGSTHYQLYDITATNEGSCALTRVVGFFSAGPGVITQAWNYDIPSGLITGYGSTLAVGQSFTAAGFVLANSSAPTLALDRPVCDSTCTSPSSGSTSSPTTSPSPTTGPTSSCPIEITHTSTTINDGSSVLYQYNISIRNIGTISVTTPIFFVRSTNAAGLEIISSSGLVIHATPIPSQALASLPPNTVIPAGTVHVTASFITNGTVIDITLDGCVSYDDATATPTAAPPVPTAVPTAAPTAAPSSAATGCSVVARITKDDYVWVDSEGRNNSIYRLSITNNGPCALVDYALSFSYYPGTLVSSWNLQSTRGGYLVTGYGGSLAAGTTYSAAGFILANAPAVVSADPYGSNCGPC